MKKNKKIKDQIIKELSKIVFADISGYINIDYKKQEQPQCFQLNGDTAAAVSSFKQSSSGIEIKMYDKLKAIEMLCDCIEMNHQNLTGEYDGLTESDRFLLQKLEKRLNIFSELKDS